MAPCSPDLNLLDFCEWGTPKDKVYTTAPTTLEDLKQRISEELSNSTPAICKKNLWKFGLTLSKL